MCHAREKPRICEANPDSRGQSGQSQVGSGRERKGISDKRNSIFKDEREEDGERERKMPCAKSGSMLLA